MSTNRIRQAEAFNQESDSIPPMPASLGYMAVALPWPQAQAFQHIYQLAYERAKKATETPRFIRRMFSVWN